MPTRILPLGLLALITSGLAVAIVGCSNAPPADPWNGTEKLRVVATFAPIQCFALNVAGNDAEVRGLLTTQGPHHADPPTSQARMLSKANLFFANGLHVDDSIAGKMANAVGKNGPKLTILGGSIPNDKLIEGVCPCCKEEGVDHTDHDHKSYDGHVWLGIEQAKIMVSAMAANFRVMDNPPLKESNYQRAANIYCEKLDKLQADGKNMLKDKKNRTILPFHGSLAYFAKSFDLKLIGPIQEVPGQEPSSKHMDEIVQQCIEQKVRVIAVEPQYSAKTSAKAIVEALRLKGHTDVEVVVIDPLETCPENEMNAEWYETKMRENLAVLEKALR